MAVLNRAAGARETSDTSVLLGGRSGQTEGKCKTGKLTTDEKGRFKPCDKCSTY